MHPKGDLEAEQDRVDTSRKQCRYHCITAPGSQEAGWGVGVRHDLTEEGERVEERAAGHTGESGGSQGLAGRGTA